MVGVVKFFIPFIMTGAIWLAYGVFFTIKDHPKKATFYIPFALFFCLWFVAEPVTILLSAYCYPALRRFVQCLHSETAFLNANDNNRPIKTNYLSYEIFSSIKQE